MKKIFALVCAAAFIFAGTVCASAEVIKFPNGLTIDVAPGWSYESNETNIVLVAGDESCAIAIIVADAEGMTSKEAAETLSKEHKGSAPQKIDETSYVYTFENEHGVGTTVIVGVEDGKLKVLSVTGQHDDADGIINSIKE
ncbi:MAG: hypothetical protein FWG09_04950 [Synergistaceae bacterium]|nr:hypothetical protein [Synergistaceae bacterium]